jgi:transposase
MRYELTDNEWSAIKPMLPNKPRGVPRVNDRRVLNGIFWVLRSGAPWRDLPDNFGPYTTCYNRFVRWRRAGVWAKLMSALAAGLRRAMTSSPPTTLPSFNSHRSGYGCALMSPRPSLLRRGCPEHLARRRASRFCPGTTSFAIRPVSMGCIRVRL